MATTDATARTRRLLALLPRLKRGARLSLADLAASAGASAEEVAGDLATLTMCGVPPFSPYDMIELDIEGDVVTVRMEPPGIDRPIRFTRREAAALAAALQAAGYEAGDPLSAKLLAAASQEVSIDELAETVRAGALPGGMAALYTTLAAAIDTRETVLIVYLTGSTERESERAVQPWRLVNRRGAWYLIAFCEHAGEERVFRLDRIRSAEPTGGRFEPPEAVSADVAPDPTRLPVAEIRFAAGSAPPDERAWPGIELEPAPDGGWLGRMPYASATWIGRRIVSRLGDAEAIGPPEVRRAVREIAASALATLR